MRHPRPEIVGTGLVVPPSGDDIRCGKDCLLDDRGGNSRVAVRNTPRMSGAEWEVMGVVWSQAPCSARQVAAELSRPNSTWHPITVRTFLGRLVKKRALTFTKRGRAYFYRPLVGEDECLDAASESFLRRFFGGSVKLMLTHLITRKKLSIREVRELRWFLVQVVEGESAAQGGPFQHKIPAACSP